MKEKLLERVEVLWYDAFKDSAGWSSIKDAEASGKKGLLCGTFGLLYKVSKKYITILTSVNEYNMCNYECIPKKFIKDIIYLKPDKKHK